MPNSGAQEESVEDIVVSLHFNLVFLGLKSLDSDKHTPLAF